MSAPARNLPAGIPFRMRTDAPAAWLIERTVPQKFLPIRTVGESNPVQSF